MDLASLHDEALERERKDQKILCVLGRGCLGPEAEGALGRIAARSENVLFATTLGAHGLLDVPAKRAVGLVGTLGSSAALSALREADFVLVLGARWPDAVLGINVNPDLHLAIKPRTAQVVLKEQDVSPLVSRYAVGDAVGLLGALADVLPERHTGTFRRPDAIDVADLRAGRIHPMVAALGEVMNSLPAGEVAVELGAGCVSIFQGMYASERQRVPIALSHDGSMGELGYTLALRAPRFVFVQVGDGEARMGLHLYLGEAVRAARLASRGRAPDRVIVVWDNEDLYNVSLLDQRTHGRAHFVQRVAVQWARLADEFPDAAPSLVVGARCENAKELQRHAPAMGLRFRAPPDPRRARRPRPRGGHPADLRRADLVIRPPSILAHEQLPQGFQRMEAEHLFDSPCCALFAARSHNRSIDPATTPPESTRSITLRIARNAARLASIPSGIATGAGKGERMMSRTNAERAHAPGLGSTSSARNVAVSA